MADINHTRSPLLHFAPPQAANSRWPHHPSAVISDRCEASTILLALFHRASMVISSGAALAVMVATMALVQGSMATNYVLGGPLAWQLNRYGDPNFYQDWARSNFPYRTTDTLEFSWSQGDSVLQVSEADYNTCNIVHPIGFWMNEGHLIFPLTEYKNRRVFFISGANSHCGSGQKFFVDVYPAA